MKWVKLSALLGGLFLAGCGSVSETGAPAPALTPPPPAPPPPVSSVAASLNIPLADLMRLINRATPEHFADLQNQRLHCGIGDCMTTLSAARTGPIMLSNRSGALAFAMPFAISADLALPAPLSALHTGVHAAGQINAVTALGLGPDWQLRPNTTGSVQFSNGRIRLGPLDTDFSTVWNANADLLSRPLLSGLDARIGPAIPLRAPILKLWAGVFAPIRLNTTPTTWLVLQPERIRVGLPAVAHETLSMGLGVDVRARLVASDEMPAVSPTALPPPAPVNGPANHFSVTVPVVLPYEEASRLALAALVRKPPHVGSHTLEIRELRFIPSGQDVVIYASFCIAERWDPTEALSGCGSGYLRGTPRYDTGAETVRIINVRTDVLTQNWMLRMMRVLAGDDLGHEMEKALVFKVGDQIRRVQGQVSAALARSQGSMVSVSGQVERYGAVSLTWNRDGFVATMPAEGSIKAELRM
jgi:hypothetical protein